MNWTKMLQPTRWKVVFSLVPFVFPVFQIWLLIQITYDYYLDVDSILFDIEEIIDFIFFTGEVYLAYPFETILRSLGWWSSNSLVVFPDGPLLPGSFAVAITYSLLIYIVWSFIHYRLNKQRQIS